MSDAVECNTLDDLGLVAIETHTMTSEGLSFLLAMGERRAFECDVCGAEHDEPDLYEYYVLSEHPDGSISPIAGPMCSPQAVTTYEWVLTAYWSIRRSVKDELMARHRYEGKMDRHRYEVKWGLFQLCMSFVGMMIGWWASRHFWP